MPEGGTLNLQARHHKYKHFCDSTHSGGTVGGHSGWAHTVICDHYSWPVASLVGMAILHTLLKEMSTSASHSHTYT